MKFSNNHFQLKTKAFCAMAVFIIIFGLFAFYLNMKANPERLFTDNYHPYEPQIMRGDSHRSNLKEAYTDGKMDSVIWEFKNLNSPIPEEYLLAGIAFLEKNQPEKAIETFKTLIQTNTNSKTDYFEEDAEYYLAMSYLSNQESEKAMPYFEKIKADPENRHYDDVSEWLILNVKNSIVKK